MLDNFFEEFKQYFPNLVAALVILAGGLLISKLALVILNKGLGRSKLEHAVRSFVLSAVRVVLYVFITVIVLSALGVPMTSIIAAIGAAGLAIGLALQNSLSNIAGGFIILVTKPFKGGDYVEIGNVSGSVESITLVYTRLLTADNKAVHIPNGQVFNSVIINYNEEPTRKLELTFPVAITENFETCKALAQKVLAQQEKILSQPDAPAVLIAGQDARSYQLLIRIWVKNEDYWALHYTLQEQVKAAFDAAKIQRPAPWLTEQDGN